MEGKITEPHINIPAELLMHFDRIAGRLRDRKASVLVGAGFSKNADTNNPKCTFPDWNELGHIFYKFLKYKEPSEDEHCLDVLHLAEEIEIKNDRPCLNDLLKKSIPDTSFQPGSLHHQLLELPWNNVFTTNYDTLLERTNKKIRKIYEYSIVKTKDDFYSAKHNKIIKLHGSLPNGLFIITEEDYRKYPKDYAPFVNAIQQILLEDTVCLIGFSGEDPNFLEWNGWLHDKLGKNSHRIYLVGLLNLTEVQKKLFEKRNIIPVDIGLCIERKDDYKQALSLFFDHLSSFEKEETPDNTIGWPEKKNKGFQFNANKDIPGQFISILENWRLTRKNYPKWIIVPEDRRTILKYDTEYCSDFLVHLSKADFPIDIELLYEYNWRIERTLTPIDNNLIAIYETIINRINPFPDDLSVENATTPNTKLPQETNWEEIATEWIDLQLSMMRFYREEGFHEKWQLIADKIKKFSGKLMPEQHGLYHCERCLYSLFKLDIPQVRKELEVWPENNALPFWEAKKAGILAEIGEIPTAERILETAIQTIRSD